MKHFHKAIYADSAALTNTTTATVHTTSAGATYELVYPEGSIPVDSGRGCTLRIRALVHATATNSTDTLASLIQIGKTGTLTTVSSQSAVDVADNDVFELTAEVHFRTKSAYYAVGKASRTGSTGQVVTTVHAGTAYPSEDLRVQVKSTWSVASASNSCKVALLEAWFDDLAPGVTAALS